METLPFTSRALQTLATAYTFSWSDPVRNRSYTTSDGGKTHYRGIGPRAAGIGTARSFLESTRLIGPDLRLVHTLFCSPACWWRKVSSNPRSTIVPVFFHRGLLIIGPGFEKGGAVCPTCAALRLGAAFPHPDVFLSFQVNPVEVEGPLDQLAALLWQDSLARWVHTHLDRLKSGELASCEMHGADGGGHPGVRWHQLLPLPGAHPLHQVTEEVARVFGIPALDWPSDTPFSCYASEEEHLYDSLVGPLASTAMALPEQEEPEALVGYVTQTGLLGCFTCWHPDVSGSGLGFSAAQAKEASTGEAVERYCGNYIPLDRLLLASECELTAGDCSYIPVGRFRWFTPEQESSAGWPLAPLRETDSIPWIEAQALGEPDEPVLLPAELVCLSLTRITRQQSRVPVPLAGIAAHRSRQDAIQAAMLELIERDATMLWWHAGLPATRLEMLPKALTEQLGSGVPGHIKQWCLLLATDMPAFVVVGCLHDLEHDILVIGCAARPSLSKAIRKASAEAWQLRRLSLLLLDEESRLWQAIRNGKLSMPVCRFRADRRYSEEFQPDFGDMHHLAYNLQYFLDPRVQPQALERLAGEPRLYQTIPQAEADGCEDVVSLSLDRLAQRGERAFCTDLTTPDMKVLGGGFVVVRITCPGLVGNTPAAFLPLAHPRMQMVLAQQGKEPYVGPMPHA